MYKIGIDEAGRGPWFGPVVACSLTWSELPQALLEGLNDSKKLSTNKREVLFSQLIELSRGKHPKVFFGVGVVDSTLIDSINIKKANQEAMRRSLEELMRKIPRDHIKAVVIDGNDHYTFEMLPKPPICIIGGDAKVPEISGASIIAKVFRDHLIETYSLLYPDLGVQDHKGYGTKKHQDALLGPQSITSAHRLSYKPIAKIVHQKPKLLLHVCCGPDATIPIVDLKKEYDLTCFWYDPNIQPKKEYQKRLHAFQEVCEIEQIPYIEGEYDVVNFLHTIKGYEHTKEQGKKCELCYDLRLKRTQLEALKLSIPYWTTTLTISPHKNLLKIFAIGAKYSLKDHCEFLKISFRKNKGFERSVEYTKKHNIYRQSYCGCIYSDSFPNPPSLSS